MSRIIIVGGYGAFGTLIVERLARDAGLQLVIVGRDARRAETEAARHRPAAKASLESAAFDAMSVTPDKLASLRPRVLINASGPFQAQDYTLARACIAAGCHYIDLADARAFVTGITALDAEARTAGVGVISGASSVPGLSSAAYLALKPNFAAVDTLEIGISPGNHFDPGEATTRSVLGGAGRPIAVLTDGAPAHVYGWQGLVRRELLGLGSRWFSHVDVPDLELFPKADPHLKTVHFRAGLEVTLYHLGLWALAGLKRAGLVADVATFTPVLLRVRQALPFLGSDRGGMFLTLTGAGHDGRPRRATWTLVATGGHGPYIPTIASIILAKRLAREPYPSDLGARPCFGLFTLDEFLAEVADLQIKSATIAK